MLREQKRLVKLGAMALDAVVVTIAFFVAYFLRVHFHAFYKFDLISHTQVITAPHGLQQYMPVLMLWTPLWLLMLNLNGLYRSFRTRSFSEMVIYIIESAFFSAFAFGSLSFILKMHFVSRVFFVIFTCLSCGLLILEKWILMSVSHYVRRMGYNYRRLLIVGTGPRAGRFVQMIKRHPQWGLRISGLIDDDLNRQGQDFAGIKVIGALNDIPGILQKNVIDEVIFVVPRMWLERIQKSIAACEIQGIKTSVAADFFDLQIAQMRQTQLNGFPLISFETTFGREWQLFGKRTIDVVVSLFGLIVFLPFLFIAALLIKINSQGPVLFRQRRIGVNGRIFTLYKLRTMYLGAEKELANFEHLNEMTGPVFKIHNDPRITVVGHFLRRFSIDELPQLFNVFFGHMSLVGPRPPISDEVDKYELWQRRRLSMRPGLTCLWQTSGRNRLSFDKWMELDLKYIDSWSLWLDFKILMHTIPTVLLGIGAS